MSTLGRRLVNWGIPVAIAATAFLNAQTFSALVGATLDPGAPVPVVGVANAATSELPSRPTADAILDRNPFDHVTGSLRVTDVVVADSVASCNGVRPIVLVASDDPVRAFAALEVDGKRIVRRMGGDAAGMRVAFIGRDSVWLEKGSTVCRATLFGREVAPPPEPAKPGVVQDALAQKIAGKIERVSPTEYRVDRGALNILLEAQAELMKLRIRPENGGMQVLGVKPGTAIAMLGIENGDRIENVGGVDVSSPEKLLELYARLKTGGIDRMTIRLVRQGKPMNVDYVVR